MTRRLKAVPDRPADMPTDVVDAYELGRQAEKAQAGREFAEGLRVGISLLSRLLAGDVKLAEDVRMIIE